MNIYLHVEISSRELDGKLLLATIAASRGHQVLISDLVGIEKGVNKEAITPGIFHTKSLSAYKDKIMRHKKMIEKGFLITSMDEEGNLNDYGYEGDAKTRFSNQTLEQSTAVFGWGSEDVETLKNIYPKFSHKIYKTGSPRADLWKPLFLDYWEVPAKTPKKPFLLISCNTGYSNNINSFGELLRFENEMGRYKSHPNHLEKTMGRSAEDFNKMIAYMEAVKYLSANNNNNYDIVFRPHPAEDIESWKIILNGIPNVHVIREGPIDAWIKKAFAVMHSSCTTALEATISKKPIITYVLNNQKYSPQLANQLGWRVKSLQELLEVSNKIFNSYKTDSNGLPFEKLPEIISKKIFLDDELAAEKIIKVWESFSKEKLSKPIDLKKLKKSLKQNVYRKIAKKMIYRFLPVKQNFNNKNIKFSNFDENDISNKVIKFQKILGLRNKVKLNFLSKKTVHLIKI